MQIFGSDGFRCRFGEKYMTPKFISKFANAIGNFYIEKDLRNPILIARDTRASGLLVEDLISAILGYKGIKIVLCGVLPTPGLSSVMQSGQYSLGIMITASHNPHFDNGIKLFNAEGYKLTELNDTEIENGILNPKEMSFGGYYSYESKTNIDAFKIYTDYVLSKFQPTKFNNSILLDCSNGACSMLVNTHLNDYGNIHFINSEPNGSNINLNCGALESEKLLQLVKEGGHDYGVAFDGDGDRSIFVSADYGVIETEKLIYLFFKIMKTSQTQDLVVSTEICNLGLAHNLEDIGVKLIQTSVGDRFVAEEVVAKKAILGAEPSGHFYFPSLSRSMDGFLGLMHFFQVLDVYGDELTDTLKFLKHYRRVNKNIPIQGKDSINIEELKRSILSEINHAEEKLILRQSIWDPVLRIYYDYIHDNRFPRVEKLLNELLIK